MWCKKVIAAYRHYTYLASAPEYSGNLTCGTTYQSQFRPKCGEKTSRSIQMMMAGQVNGGSCCDLLYP